MYKVFVRNFWRWETSRYGIKKLVPALNSRKEIIGCTPSESMAREMCEEYNSTHEPGELSRKAEYTKI